MREIVHFAHGNGFPSLCYKQLLDRLSERFDCIYIDKLGHNRDFPVTENWQYLVNELIASVQTQASQPVVAIGHSLGGVLSLLAAMIQPQLFKSVILLDSPFINQFKSAILRFSKVFGLIDSVTPALRTRNRRQHWETRDDVLAYLKERQLFKYFTSACLNDYIDYGLQKDDSGYSLRFDSEVEYQIYRTIPHDLYRHQGKLRTPTALIYGTQSTVIDYFDLRHMKNDYGILTFAINGTHMFPMECPDLAANMIFEAVWQLEH